MTRIPALDGLRGIAILLVVLYHYFEAPHPTGMARVLHHISSLGWTGVDLFFVLSGFLITTILIETRQSPRYFQSFYARRILRIFPVYFLVLAAVFVVLPRFGLSRAWLASGGDPLWFWLFLSNWDMGSAGAWAPGGLAVFWSLAIEEQFYLAWAPLVRVLGTRALERAAVGLVLLPLLLRIALVGTGAVSPVAIHVFTVTRLDVLAVGAGIALWLHRAPPLEAVRRIGRAALVLGAGVTAGCLLAQGSTRWDGWAVQSVGLTTLAVTYGGLLLVTLAAAPPSRLANALTSRPLQVLGKYSYAVYLLHAIVWYEVLTAVAARPAPLLALARHGVPPWLALPAAAMALTLLLAIASWHGIEKRCLALKRHFPA